MEVQQNTNSDYDYDLQQAGTTLSREGVFHPMELDSIEVLEQILNGTIEMKHHDSAMTTGNLLIEYEIDKKNDGTFEPSGLSLTKAKYYFFNIGDAGLFLTVDSIKWMCRLHKRFKLRKAKNRDTSRGYVGRGFLIPLGQLPFLLGFYQQEVLGKPLTFGKN